MKFAPKLTALFIIIGAIIAAVMFTIVYFQVEKILESEIRARMENRVFFTMDALERFLSERLSDIKMIAKDSVISSEDATAEQITEKLIFFRNAYKCYASFSFFNLERIRIADTAGLDIGEQNRMTPYWEEVLSGKVSAASDVHIAGDLQVPVVYFASAVDNKEGRAIGVVVARIPINRLFEMVKGGAKIQEEEEEEEEDIDIMNKDGLLIYSNHNREGILKENLPEWESVKIAQREKIFGSDRHRNPGEKETALYAFCREQGHLDFKGNGWTIFFHIPTRVILTPVNKLLNILTIMFLAMLPGLALVSYLFSKTVSLPLTRLSFAVAEIGKGKLDTVIEVKSKDEFGSLANTLSQMTADLKKTTVSIDNLNKEITERKQAEEALLAAKDYTENIIKSMFDTLIVISPDGKIKSINKAVTVLLGYKEEELIGKPFGTLVAEEEEEEEEEEEDIPFIGTRLKKLIKEGFIKEYDTAYKTKSGERILVSLSGAVMRDKDGKLIGIICIGRDLRVRKKAEEALRQSEERYRRQFEEAIDAIFLASPEGILLDCNIAATELVERAKSEIIGQHQSFLHPAEKMIDGVSQTFKRHISGESSVAIEDRVITKSGQIKDVAIRASIITLEGKKAIQGIFRDITESKRMEEALRESEMKHRTLIENLSQKIFMKDRNLVYVSCNENYARDLKIKAEEITGKTDYEFYSKELAEKYRADDKRIIGSGKTEEIEEKYIQDKEERFIQTIKTPIKDEQGNVVGILGIFWDITERRQAEEELKLAYKNLQQTQQELIQVSKMAAMGQLAAGISHELNQPLTGIKGFTQAVLADLEKESPFRSDLNKIVEQADRIDTIIKNVRFFARKSDFNMVETDINQVISESLMLLNQQLKVHNIRVIQELGLGIPKMQGDPNQLQQAFINIINNARDAILSLARPEGGEIRIRTALAQDKKYIQIIFQDTGGGIPEENLENMFTPFFTTKSPDKGMGLGLSITYRIIENHHGKIDFKTKVGEGTTFRIVLPLREGGGDITKINRKIKK